MVDCGAGEVRVLLVVEARGRWEPVQLAVANVRWYNPLCMTARYTMHMLTADSPPPAV